MLIKEIELEAEKILDSSGIKTTPIPVESIAKKYNIKISRSPSKEFSGLLIRKDGESLIGVSSSEPPARQRFTIAHELGHYFLHPKKKTFVDYYRDNKKNLIRKPWEVQANMFAAAILMPRKYLEKDFTQLAKEGFFEEDLKFLADKYKVSEEAMNFRLINLKLSV